MDGCGNKYSNFGYMVLGLIIERITGKSVAQNALDRLLAGKWAPATDLYLGRTLPGDRGPREPDYESMYSGPTVFDPIPWSVPAPDGTFHLEAMQGHGNLVSGAVPLLRFLERYPAGNVWDFRGSLPGSSTTLQLRGDGTRVAILMNDRDANNAQELYERIAAGLDARGSSIVWPSECVDGFWVDFGAPGSVHGSYDQPFSGIPQLLQNTVDDTRVRVRPGHTAWTGVLSQRLQLLAPHGGVTIGDNP